MWLQDRLTGLAPRQRLSLVGEGGLAAEHLGHKGWNVTAGLSAPHPSSGDPVCTPSLLRGPCLQSVPPQATCLQVFLSSGIAGHPAGAVATLSCSAVGPVLQRALS